MQATATTAPCVRSLAKARPATAWSLQASSNDFLYKNVLLVMVSGAEGKRLYGRAVCGNADFSRTARQFVRACGRLTNALPAPHKAGCPGRKPPVRSGHSAPPPALPAARPSACRQARDARPQPGHGSVCVVGSNGFHVRPLRGILFLPVPIRSGAPCFSVLAGGRGSGAFPAPARACLQGRVFRFLHTVSKGRYPAFRPRFSWLQG